MEAARDTKQSAIGSSWAVLQHSWLTKIDVLLRVGPFLKSYHILLWFPDGAKTSTYQSQWRLYVASGEMLYMYLSRASICRWSHFRVTLSSLLLMVAALTWKPPAPCVSLLALLRRDSKSSWWESSSCWNPCSSQQGKQRRMTLECHSTGNI